MDQSKPPDIENKKPESLPRKQSIVWIALKKVKTNLSLTDKGATPVNWKLIGLVFLSLFSSSFTITFLFPFLPEMILVSTVCAMSFGYVEVEKGYYAGIVASSMFAGRAFGSYFWGWLSDVKGRKPVMLITILLNGLATLAFGFTTNIYFAIVTRFFTGLFNGTVGTAKTVLYEISNNTNQAVGMSIISVAWGMGMILGPTIGGYLANPCKRYPELFAPEGIFYDFPYLLPTVFPFILCIIATVVDFIWLPETLHKKKREELTVEIAEDPENIPDERTSLHSVHSLTVHRRYVTGASMALSVENLHVEAEGATYLAGAGQELHVSRHGITVTDVNDRGAHHSHTGVCSRSSEHLDDADINSSHSNTKGFFLSDDEGYSNCDETKLGTGYENHKHDTSSDHEKCTLLSHNNTCVVKSSENDGCQIAEEEEVKINGDVHKTGTTRCCSICHILLNWGPVKLLRQYEVFLAITMYSAFSFGVVGLEEIFTVWAATDIQLDGLGLEPNEIGAVLGVSSIPLLCLQFFLFPNLVRRFSVKWTFVGCAVIQIVLTTAMPTLHLLINQPATLWTLVLAVNMPMKLMTSCVFSCTSLFLNNSVTPGLAGSVNGLGMTITAMARFLAPLIGGTVYSWTVGYASDNIGPPFDVSFTFFLFGFVLWCITILGVFVPETLNKQKKLDG